MLMKQIKVKLCAADFKIKNASVVSWCNRVYLVVAYIGMTFNDVHSSHCCNCAANAIGQEMVLRQRNFGQGENVKGSSNQVSHNSLTQALMMLTFKMVSSRKSNSNFENQHAAHM